MARPKKSSRTSVKKKTAATKASKSAPKKTVAKRAAPKKTVAKRAAPKKADLARKVARDVASSVEHPARAFIEGKGITTDALAEELGEDAVRAMTTGEDGEGERDGERVAESGGPFVVSSIVD